jgi:cell division protein FtsI/penicillin-binding protein 2
MQVLVGVSAIANEGRVLRPKLIKGQEIEIKNEVVFSEENFKDVKRAMRETVLSGTTQSLNFGFLEVASKSGTAQIKRNTRENS